MGKVPNHNVKLLSDSIDGIKNCISPKFKRCPRRIDSDLEYFKAMADRLILLYTGPFIFRNIFPREAFQHFIRMHLYFCLFKLH